MSASAVLLSVFAVAIAMALELRLTDALGPGPGFFPFCLGLIGAGLSAALALEVAREPASGEQVLARGSALARTLAVLVALVAAAFALEQLGYRLTALIFISGLLVALGARSLFAIGSLAIIGSFGVFHVFYYWLKVPLPIGRLGL